MTQYDFLFRVIYPSIYFLLIGAFRSTVGIFSVVVEATRLPFSDVFLDLSAINLPVAYFDVFI